MKPYKSIYEAELSTTQRKNLPKSDFVFPDKAPGSGSYPIPDEKHARNALARVSQYGTPAEKSAVIKAVKSKFPNIEVEEKRIRKEASPNDRQFVRDMAEAMADYLKMNFDTVYAWIKKWDIDTVEVMAKYTQNGKVAILVSSILDDKPL